MQIIKTRKQDIVKIAEIHLSAFQVFFLTSLGKGFLSFIIPAG